MLCLVSPGKGVQVRFPEEPKRHNVTRMAGLQLVEA